MRPERGTYKNSNGSTRLVSRGTFGRASQPRKAAIYRVSNTPTKTAVAGIPSCVNTRSMAPRGEQVDI